MTANKSSKQIKKPEELQKASEALYYEIVMLNSCASTLNECLKNKFLFSQFTINILIESFCVHLRNFIEFFNKKNNDRITHEDFLDENTIIKYPHNLYDKYSEKVNNLLSHLTFYRLSYSIDKKDWNLWQIANEVNENIFKFFNKANKQKLCEKVIEYINVLQYRETIDYNRYTCSTSDVILPSETVTRFSKEW